MIVAFCTAALPIRCANERVAALVVGEDALLLLGDDPPLLQAGDDALERVVEVGLRDHRRAFRRPAAIAASLQMFARSAPVSPAVWRATDSRSTSSPSGLPRVCTSRIAARPFRSGGWMRIWRSKRPGPQQRRVEILQAVRRAHHDHLVARAEAVELDEQLVQRLVLLAVEGVAAARLADGVELVDEDDRRRVLARLLEELADAGGAEAGEHLDERRGALRVEARARLVRDRLRGERLAGAGRAVEEDPLRHPRAERSKRFGSRRKSTTSCSSSFASSSPATSSQVTDDDEPGVISIGLTRGISLTVRQSSQTTTHMSRKNATGSHVRAKSEMDFERSKPSAIEAPIGRRVPGLKPGRDVADRREARRRRSRQAATQAAVRPRRAPARPPRRSVTRAAARQEAADRSVRRRRRWRRRRRSSRRGRAALEQALGVRVREDVEVLLQEQELAAAEPALGHRRERRAARDRAAPVSAIFSAPRVPRRQCGGYVSRSRASPRSRRRSARGRPPRRRAGCRPRAPPRRAVPSPGSARRRVRNGELSLAATKSTCVSTSQRIRLMGRARAAGSAAGGGPNFADGRPSVITMSAVKSFEPRISDEPTPYASTGTPRSSKSRIFSTVNPPETTIRTRRSRRRRARRAPSRRAARSRRSA